MRRTIVTVTTVALALLLLIPAGSAQSTQYFATSGDEIYRQDGAECLEAVGFDPANIEEGQDTCVVLYGHIFDLLNAVPINIQPPPGAQPDLSRGFTGAPNVEQLGFDNNQLPLYSSPGFVEYASPDDTEPRLHPERGITDTVDLSDTVPVTGYWYLSADFDEVSVAGGDPAANPDVGVMPCVTVRMVLETGRVHNQGTYLAEGFETKVLVNQDGGAGGASPAPAEVDCSGFGNSAESAEVMMPEDVTEFKVDMGVAKGDIPKIEAFLVYVEWYQWHPGDPDNKEKIGQHQWNLHTGGEYRNRVLIPVKNPVRIEEVRPQFFDGKIYIHGVFNSPWGSYDVDPSSIEITIKDADGNVVEANNIEPAILRYSVDHDGHFKPVNATFPWDYKADGLGPGEYSIEVTAMNWQHTGIAKKVGKVVIGSNADDVETFDDSGNKQENIDTRLNQAEEGPGAGVILLTTALLGLLGAARYRRRD